MFNKLSMLTLVVFLTNTQAWSMLRLSGARSLSSISKSFPADSFRITPGKTPGFDHQKFLALRNKTITAINQKEIQLLHKIVSSNKAYSYQDYDLRNPKVLRKIAENFELPEQKTLFKPNNSNCDVEIDEPTYSFIANCLRQNGVNPANIFVHLNKDKQLDLVMMAMATCCIPSSPQIHHLVIARDLYQSSKHIISNNNVSDFKSMVQKHFFEFTLVHEASHIRHLDGLMRNLLLINRCPLPLDFEMAKIQEERADIYSVFDGPNPIFQKLFLKDNVTGDEYSHRAKPTWDLELKEIASCYSQQLLKDSVKLVEQICG